jgi:4-diphosphocytidyl-2-C-methyl-D-erythritol kinase
VTDELELFSPAKLNLFFRVHSKRADGYHEISSLYQAIDLGDTLQLRLSDQDRLSCNDPQIPTDWTNLVWKALHVFRKETGKMDKVQIHLEKRIPIQAGLGGGSSNAATLLWGINQLLGEVVSEETLSHFAASFSSDAPFFFSQGSAYCRGRGEILEPVAPLPRHTLWLAKPQEGLSTPLVYQQCQSHQFPPRNPIETLAEISAFTLLPSLLTLKKNLQALGFSSVTMTGSGTAFFCTGTPLERPHLEGVQFSPIRYLYRSTKDWYKCTQKTA